MDNQKQIAEQSFWSWYGRFLAKLFRLKWLVALFKNEMLWSFIIAILSGVAIILAPILICMTPSGREGNVIPINGLWLLLIEPVVVTIFLYGFWLGCIKGYVNDGE